jgi:hypothetical protein
MLTGWQQTSDDLPGWHRRSIEYGLIWISVDLWPTSDDDRDWAICRNDGLREQFTAKTADLAMKAADKILARHLRAAAKLCRT